MSVDEHAEDAAPTELAGVAEAETQSAYAWGLDDGSDEDDDLEPQRRRPFVIVAVAVGASLSLAMIAGVLAYRYVGDDQADPAPATTTAVAVAPPSPAPPPVTVTTVIVQAPPSTVQVPAQAQPQEPDILPPAVLASLDDRFIANLKARGWYITDAGMLARDAHKLCAYLQQGGSMESAVQTYAAASGRGLADAQVFTSTVVGTYPNCP